MPFFSLFLLPNLHAIHCTNDFLFLFLFFSLGNRLGQKKLLTARQLCSFYSLYLAVKQRIQNSMSTKESQKLTNDSFFELALFSFQFSSKIGIRFLNPMIDWKISFIYISIFILYIYILSSIIFYIYILI